MLATPPPYAQEETDMIDDVIERTDDGPVRILTMTYRPYNLMGPVLIGALLQALRDAVGEGKRAVLLKSGLRHFCAGADVGLFGDRIDADGRGARDPVETLRTFELLPIPIVAAVHGACLGGGLELALACDYIVVAASAKIGSVEVALGLHPLLGGIQRQVQRIGATRAKEMSMLGRRYDAATLERWGLINLVVPDETLFDTALTVARELGNGPTVAHAATKRLVSIAVNQGVEAADLAMREIQKPIWASEDLKAGLASFRANGPGLATFEGR
jgi:enoyl-CoA hydratase/carnithine racemase